MNLLSLLNITKNVDQKPVDGKLCSDCESFRVPVKLTGLIASRPIRRIRAPLNLDLMRIWKLVKAA